MAKKQDPSELLDKITATYKEASKRKAAIVQFEKTASTKIVSIDKLVKTGKDKIDISVDELQTRLKQESDNYKSSAKEKLSEVELLRSSTKRDHNIFIRAFTAAMNKKNGIEPKYDKVLKLTDEVTNNALLVSKSETKTRNAAEQVSSILTSAKKNEKDISVIHEGAVIINQAIQDTYSLTLDTTMSGSLIERRDALKSRTDTWQKWYLVSVGAIVVAIIAALVSLLMNSTTNLAQLIGERLTFITPLVIISFVLARQFGHERKLYEEYAFKAAAAQTLRGYTILLNDQFKDMPDARKEILDFTIRAMDEIYDRKPLAQTPTFIHLVFGNRLAKFEAILDDRIREAILNEASHTSRVSSTTSSSIESK